MKTYELTNVQGKNVVIDISQLFKKEVLYINATKLAKQFGKTSNGLYKFLNSGSFKEYENAVNRITQKGDTLVTKNQRGEYAGTYIHSDLIIYFLRWLDVDFAVKCDMYLRNKIQEAHDELVATRATINANKANEIWTPIRKQSKETRKRLTDTIKTFCKYAEDSRGATYKDNKCPYYILLSKLVYDVLELKRPKDRKPLRDIFSAPIVAKIEQMEEEQTILIEEVITNGMEYHEAFKYIKREVKKLM